MIDYDIPAVPVSISRFSEDTPVVQEHLYALFRMFIYLFMPTTLFSYHFYIGVSKLQLSWAGAVNGSSGTTLMSSAALFF